MAIVCSTVYYVRFLFIPPACSKYKNIEPIPNEAIIEGEFKSPLVTFFILTIINYKAT